MDELNFRKLNEGECRILLMRHAEHNNDVLTPAGEQTAKDVGKKITAKLALDVCYVSPAKRTVATAWHVKNGFNIPVVREERLNNLSAQSPILLQKIQNEAKERGLKSGEGYAEIIFNNGEYKKVFQKRAEDTKMFLQEIAKKHAGKNVFCVSHGLSRIEIAIQALRGETVHKPEKFFNTGDVAELIINSETGELVEINYLNF